MRSVIDNGEQLLQLSISSEFKEFIASLYTEAFAGLMITWLKNKNNPDKEQLIQNILFVCQTSIPYLLRKEAERESEK